ncbi:MAG: hypothetical protein OEX04_11635 [Acidimicrobiia bacterium]|nr:hypothetical protein [Acidimicrobiia bacterium]MDH4308119.1 hypothetical protein [Acidimicrobiia bacterium]
MTEFIVEIPSAPGSLARLAGMLAGAGVNIDALAGWNGNGDGVVRVVVNDPDTCRRTLAESGLRFAERQVLVLNLPNRPGSLAGVAESLAAAGVNIEAIYVMGGGRESLDVAIAVDEAESAATALAAD